MTYDSEIFPLLDQHDDDTLDPVRGPMLAEKAAHRWTEENTEEWTPYNNSLNADLLIGWCTANVVPVSLRNLTYAFRNLVRNGQLKQRDDYETDVVENIAQEFARRYPQFEPYFYSDNFDKVEEYRNQRNLPLSVEVLNQLFTELVSKRLILPGETGFVTGKKRPMTEAEKFAAREEFERASALSEAGKPVSKELKQAYQASLKGGPTQAKNYQERVRDARVAVGNAHPELDIYSREFDRLMSAELAK
jgi:hypothetical protein